METNGNESVILGENKAKIEVLEEAIKELKENIVNLENRCSNFEIDTDRLREKIYKLEETTAIAEAAIEVATEEVIEEVAEEAGEETVLEELTKDIPVRKAWRGVF